MSASIGPKATGTSPTKSLAARREDPEERGRDVVRIAKPTCSDEPREQVVDVVVVRFGAPQFRGERAERVGFDRSLSIPAESPDARNNDAQRSC